MLPGTGVETPGMGRRLLDEDAAFARAIARCDQAASGLFQRPLREFLAGEAEAGGPGYRTAALAAFEIGIAAALEARGVAASLHVGCSVGEIAALALAGALSPEDAFGHIAAQALALRDTVGPGALIFALGDPDLAGEIADWPDLEIAGCYGPGLLLVAAVDASAAGVTARLEALGAAVQRLPVDHAVHSRLIDAARGPVEAAAQSIRWRAPTAPVLSAATGENAAGDAAHLWRVMREPIRFDRAIRAAQARGARIGLDIGPTGSLATAAARVTGRRLRTAPAVTLAENGAAALDRAAALVL